MGLDDGFLRWQRQAGPKRAAAERVRDSAEVVGLRDEAVAREQAGRCMDCGVPFCHQGCPLGNEIPDWNDLVYRGAWREAHERLDSTNNFPEFTGRLCPAPCEAACTLAINDDAVTIEQIELEIAERAFAEGWVQPKTPKTRTSHTVAVVGSGPAGLAAAAQLNLAGHTVTVYEADDRIGGLLRYGIPDFKLDKATLDRRISLMQAAGVRFVTNAQVGDTPRWDALQATHDAILIAVGAGRPRDVGVPGRELAGVHFAMDYLAAANRRVAGDLDRVPPNLDARGKRVVILGGGDTGSDCLGTALRQEAANVTQIELLPRPPDARDASTPWPHWPLVYRTSSSQEEGGSRDFALLTQRFTGRDGQVAGVEAVRVARKPEGGFAQLDEAPVHIEAELVLLAVGFLGPGAASVVDQLGVALDDRGRIATVAPYTTSVPGVYTAGDARRGQSLIVWAIAEGREAACVIDKALGGTTSLPTRGADHPF